MRSPGLTVPSTRFMTSLRSAGRSKTIQGRATALKVSSAPPRRVQFLRTRGPSLLKCQWQAPPTSLSGRGTQVHESQITLPHPSALMGQDSTMLTLEKTRSSHLSSDIPNRCSTL